MRARAARRGRFVRAVANIESVRFRTAFSALAKLLRSTYLTATVTLTKALDFIGFIDALSVPARLHQFSDIAIVWGAMAPKTPER
jgi:hypothetical protein